jgi:tetratricopeptide (TPR) repeat protein
MIFAAVAMLAACAADPGKPSTVEASADMIVAELALERGDCRAATDQYARAAAVAEAPEATIKRALEVALDCQQFAAAEKLAPLWRQRAPGSADAARMEGLVALRLGRNSAAAAAFRDAVRLSGDAPGKALTGLVEAASTTGNDFGTYMAVRSAVDTKALDAPALVLLGNLALESYVFRDARSLADSAIARDPQSAAAQQLLAQVLAGSDDAAGAIAAANAARRLDPKGQVFTLAETLVQLDRIEEARIELERLLQDDDAGPQAERRLALLAYREGDVQEAAGRFSQRLRTGDDPAEALFYLGALAERHGNGQAALEMYDRLVQAGAGLIARRRAAAVLMKQGKRAEAFAMLDAQEADKPGVVVDVVLAKAALLIDNDAAAAALPLLDAALERYPGHPGVEYQRALALESAGRVRDAIAAFDSLHRKRPDDPGLMNALGYTLADHSQSLSRANRLIDSALAMTPDNPAILDSQGWVRFRRGEAVQALAPLTRAYRLSRDTEIAAHWGEVLWSLGREGEARAVWARALARDPDSRRLKAAIGSHIPVPAQSPAPAQSPMPPL